MLYLFSLFRCPVSWV